MMDKGKRTDMLRMLESGAITVPEACQRYEVSERHVRRLLAQFRKPKPEKATASDVSVTPPPVVTFPRGGGVAPASPDIKPMPDAAPTPPTMADIDRAMSGQAPGAKPAAVDPALTADMALQGIRMAKVLFVLTSAELLGVTPDEKTMQKLTQILPVTETVIRMQKPEAWAALGEMGSSPWALIGVLVADTALTGFTLWKMRMVELKKAEDPK